jgi:hypothetical protein
MRLTGDITSPRLLAVKGMLFALAACASTAAVVALAMQHGDWRVLSAAHVVSVWCACRAYYFAFYVIERYAGGGPYAGLLAAMRSALGMMRRSSIASRNTSS